ncbi:hypothetical protein H7E67_19450 [Clostridium gasigenes]|nr:hypothetical protein [Clostridium gasigenes]MBB6625579.1 hypothetical protein [Clostridium gasigenes]
MDYTFLGTMAILAILTYMGSRDTNIKNKIMIKSNKKIKQLRIHIKG